VVDFRAFSILDAILSEPPPTTGFNPYAAGNFYSGSFITDQFVQTFDEIFADERVAIIAEIAPNPDVSVLVMKHSYVIFQLNEIHKAYSFHYVNTSGVLQGVGSIPVFTGKKTNFITTLLHPTALVLTDENGTLRYVMSNPTTFALTSTATKPGFRDDFFQFFGEFIEFVGADGQTIYRLTVNSSNAISVTPVRIEAIRNQPLYVSNGHPRPYIDGKLYIGSLARIGDISTRMEETETGFGGICIPSVGMMTIQLSDGYFDAVVNQSWDTRDVTISAGLTTVPISQYRVILRTQTEHVEWDLDELNITLRDQSILFDRTIQENTYAGTGGYEGTEGIKGNIKPLIFGFVAHASPVLLDPNLNLYQFNDGPSHQSTSIEVRQGGIVMGTWIPDTNLLTWSPTPADVSNGALRVDFTRGMFRLAAPPEGVITFTKHGVTDVPISGQLPDIIRAIISRRIPEITIDTQAFDFHKSALPHSYGLYIRESRSVGDVIRDLCAPTNNLVSLTRLNVLTIRQITRTSARAFITNSSIAENSSLSRRNAPTPASQYRMSYEKTWTVLDDSQLLGAAVNDPVVRHVMLDEFRWNQFPVAGTDQPGLKRYDSSKSVELTTTHLVAYNELVMEIVLRDYSQRDLYDITVVGFSFLFEVGETVLIQLERWGMHVPRSMIIVAITEISPTSSSEDQTRLLLWG
jgi:hypothetical protein